MKFSVNQKDLQESLSFCQNVIERRSTLPILSNVLLEASGKELIITATDLDMIFVHRVQSVEIENLHLFNSFKKLCESKLISSASKPSSINGNS